MNKLTILHYHAWADHSELLNISIQSFTYYNVQLKHVHSLDQLQIDLFADASSSPIVIVDIDLVSAEIIEKIANLIREKSPICTFVLTADKRTKECIKLLDLELCGYLSLQDYSARALEQSMAFVHRNFKLKQKAVEKIEQLKLLKLGLNQSANCVVITNIDGEIEYVNDAFEKLTGYNRLEVIGQNPRVLKSGAQPKEFYAQLWSTIIAGKEWHGEFKNRKKNGDYYWEKATISPVFNKKGRVGHFIAIKENITEEKRIKDELKLSEESHARAQRIGNIAHWILELATKEIEWSDQVYAIYGKPMDFKPDFDSVIACILPQDVEKVQHALNLSIENDIGNHVVHGIYSEGQIKYVEERWEVLRNEDKEVTRLIGTCRDITTQRNLEFDLHNKSETLRSVLASMDDLVFLMDANGNFCEFFQPERHNMLLMEPNEFIGRHYSEVLPAPVASLFMKKFMSVKKNHVIETLEYSLEIGKKENWFNAKISIALSPEGKENKFTVVIRNITDDLLLQKALMESEQKYKIQSELLPHVHWVSNSEGDTIYINRKGQEFYGKDLSFKELNSWSIIHPNDVDSAKQLWKTAFSNKTEYSNIERHRHYSGSFHWMQVNTTPVLNDKGEVLYWIGIATDIDELINIRNEKDKLLFDLNERMKEVKCLYLISYLAQSWDGELDDFFNEILPIIKDGFAFPSHIQVGIIHKGKKYQSAQLRYKNRITKDLIVSNVKVGKLILALPKSKTTEGKIDFLDEEYLLVESIATNICLVIERTMKDIEIKESQQQYETLVQNATIGIGILKGDKWINSNLTLEAMFGAQKEDIIGKSPWDFSPTFQPDGMLSKKKAQDSIKELSDKESRSFYWQHTLLDKTLIDCEIQLNRVLMNGEYHVLVFLRDITKEKAAVENLVQKEAEYRNIFINMQEGYMLLDMDGEIVSINPTGVKLIGAESADNIIGKNSALYFTSNIKQLFTNNQLLEKGLLNNYGLELSSLAGELRSIEFNLRLVKNENAPWLIETTFRDITEKAGHEKLKAATIKLYEAYEIGYDHLIQVGLDNAVDLMNSKFGFYYLIDEDDETVQLVQWSRGTNETLDTSKLIKEYASKDAKSWIKEIKKNAPVLHNDYDTLKRHGALSEYNGLIRDLEVPIINKGEVIAIFGVGDKMFPYTELDQQLLLVYAQTFYSVLSRKKAEDEYLHTLEIFNQSQRVGKIGTWRFDIDNDDTWWSDAMYDIYGFENEEEIPQNWLDFIYPDDRKGMLESFENALVSGIYKYEYRFIRPDGELINIYAQAKVEIDEASQHKYYVGIAQDITEITRAVDQLHAKNIQFENIVEAVSGIVYRIGYPNIEFMFLSDYVTTMLGYDKKVFEGNLNLDFIKSLIHPDDFDEVTDQVLAFLGSSENYFLNYRMITADDQVIWVSNSGKVIKENEGWILEGFIFDVTDRVKGEERIMNAVMQASDNEKARISKEIHDSLQQTLTIASLNLGYLVRERDQLSEKAKPKLDLGMEYLKKSLDDSRQIAHRLMPKAILDFGLVPVIEGMVVELNRTSNVHINFFTNMHERRIKLIIENNFYKIVQEALNNILKHAKAKVVTIQYMLLDKMLQLSIEDDGIGFNTKLFKPNDLSGFGLASMRSRATALSAEFFLDSFPGHGTTIIIEIPYSKEIEYLPEQEI